MPVPAVPRYLGKDFRSASPGLRFGYYLGIWTDKEDQQQEVRKAARNRSREGREVAAVLQAQGMDAAIAHMRERRQSFPGIWDKNDAAAREVWAEVIALNGDDLRRAAALEHRQSALAGSYPEGVVLQLHARATAPFTTGLGLEHPLENGFAFLWPYGLPYLPGSGVKGVIRRAAGELAEGLWGDRCGWDAETRYQAPGEESGGAARGLSMIDLLFGAEPSPGSRDHFRGCLVFWDVHPQVQAGGLRVEVMTPHQSHYYQKGEPPHDCGQPVPIQFLTIAPGAGFDFRVLCDVSRLTRLAPDLAERWRDLLTAAFEHAFDWLGFGAKTAVGYGAMEVDRKRLRAAEEEARRQAAERERRKAEERARAEEAARPESVKARKRLEEFVAPLQPPLIHDRYKQLVSEIGEYLKSARGWSVEERREAVALVEALYERFGWAEPGQKSAKRKKQEARKRQRLQALLEEIPRREDP